MRRVHLAVAALVLGLLAPIAAAGGATAQVVTCSGPAPTVHVGRHVATGAIPVDAAAVGWTCTGGVTPTLSMQVMPSNILAALLVPGSVRSGGAVIHYEVPFSIQGSLLLRPPACFLATLTVTGGGAVRTATGQGCG